MASCSGSGTPSCTCCPGAASATASRCTTRTSLDCPMRCDLHVDGSLQHTVWLRLRAASATTVAANPRATVDQTWRWPAPRSWGWGLGRKSPLRAACLHLGTQLLWHAPTSRTMATHPPVSLLCKLRPRPAARIDNKNMNTSLPGALNCWIAVSLRAAWGREHAHFAAHVTVRSRAGCLRPPPQPPPPPPPPPLPQNHLCSRLVLPSMRRYCIAPPPSVSGSARQRK